MDACGLVKTSRETSMDTLITKLGQKIIGTFVHVDLVGLCNHASQTR